MTQCLSTKPGQVHTAYASTAFLMRYFRTHEHSAALDPFAYYCWLAGVSVLVYLRFAENG
jgi:undecaprenyl pyrophosphate phosphatase UppP